MFISTCVLVVHLTYINSHKETHYFDDAYAIYRVELCIIFHMVYMHV